MDSMHPGVATSLASIFIIRETTLCVLGAADRPGQPDRPPVDLREAVGTRNRERLPRGGKRREKPQAAAMRR